MLDFDVVLIANQLCSIAKNFTVVVGHFSLHRGVVEAFRSNKHDFQN